MQVVRGQKHIIVKSCQFGQIDFTILVIAYKGGRPVNLNEILKHELTPVPLTSVETHCSLRAIVREN